jgi:hypothetical protein
VFLNKIYLSTIYTILFLKATRIETVLTAYIEIDVHVKFFCSHSLNSLNILYNYILTYILYTLPNFIMQFCILLHSRMTTSIYNFLTFIHSKEIKYISFLKCKNT